MWNMVQWERHQILLWLLNQDSSYVRENRHEQIEQDMYNLLHFVKNVLEAVELREPRVKGMVI
jgi:hypothetical protein